uniref:AsIV-cont00072-ORF2 n=1 Tax=Apophua simplicipes ichnovirus TaxID=1329648 RepID=S5DML1_9VIRU|nr:AsIV-cont00072-ORF2 [Apophua simplicipes ichnovirus]
MMETSSITHNTFQNKLPYRLTKSPTAFTVPIILAHLELCIICMRLFPFLAAKSRNCIGASYRMLCSDNFAGLMVDTVILSWSFFVTAGATQLSLVVLDGIGL